MRDVSQPGLVTDYEARSLRAWGHNRWHHGLYVATGILIAESLHDDATLQGSWQLTRIERITATNLSEARRAAGLPSAWTGLHLELGDAQAQALAQALADQLLRASWHAEFNTEAEIDRVRRPSVPIPQRRRRGQSRGLRL